MDRQCEARCFSPLVGIARLPVCSYPAPGSAENPVADALGRVAGYLQWSNRSGSFGDVITQDARVLIKPNFVLHQNQGPSDLEPLITHSSLVRATVEAALESGAREVLVGDAPIQSCDFAALLRATGLDSWASDLAGNNPRFKGIKDFRRTTCLVTRGVRVAAEAAQPLEEFALFNLGTDSLLEPITNDGGGFRVSWYDSRPLSRAHHRGCHQYLVTKEVLNADVVINLPKLKTHKKAGVTCALKNSIGINGNKEFLPHHRIGGSATGGDCYPGGSAVKLALERVADRQNRASSSTAAMIWHAFAFGLSRVARWQGDRVGIDGSWSGNDTIWRTCLDINRILLYGRPDASMAEIPQRRILHLVDAVVAGQGNGPLASDPLQLGLILASENPVAMDWAGALLLGYDPARIPIICRGFERFRWPLVTFPPEDVHVTGDLGEGAAGAVLRPSYTVEHPLGWRDAAATRVGRPDSRTAPQLPPLTQSWDA